MPQKKFIRTNARNYSKLGVRRKNKKKYRKGKGIDNKMRLNMKGHSRKVKAGFRSEKKTRDLVKELKPVRINNVNDLKKIKQGMIGVIAKIGDKNKKEILELVLKENIKISFNARKALSKIEAKLGKAKKKKEERKAKQIAKDKKAEKKAEKNKKEGEKKGEEKSPEDDIKKENKEKSEEKKDTKEKPESKKQIQTNNYGRGK